VSGFAIVLAEPLPKTTLASRLVVVDSDVHALGNAERGEIPFLFLKVLPHQANAFFEGNHQLGC
jgi:hypothetical protein